MNAEPLRPAPNLTAEEARSWLSALADGEAAAAEPACAAWRQDAEARRTWHAYQLIGDVMRSEDLARPAAGDAAFLAGLRERLAAEPVVLAPEPVPAVAPGAVVSARRRQAWLMPVAAAAGFAVVAGVLVVARVGLPGGTADAPAGFAGAGNPAVAVVPVANGLTRPVSVGQADGEAVLRDERLDEYLRAHQIARGGATITAPSSALRRVDLAVPAQAQR
jgi:sigma-E factor negative regulatory protein RseA